MANFFSGDRMRIERENGNLVMAYIFLAIIIFFAGLSAVYFYQNDFAKETLETLFPAVGAILLSLYLGFKSVVIDAPKPEKFSITIAVLHDWGNGAIRGMAPKTAWPHSEIAELRGARLLDRLPELNAFKDLDLPKNLRPDPTDPLEISAHISILIEQFVEYALLSWLCEQDMKIGHVEDNSTFMNMSSHSFVPGKELVRTPIVVERTRNPLLVAAPIFPELPKGSKIVLSDKHPGEIKIVTPNTLLQLRDIGGGRTSLSVASQDRDSLRVFSALGLPIEASTLHIVGITLEVKASQSSFSRFSNQAKLESEWIARVHEQMVKDFSWDRLKTAYIEDKH